MIFWDPQTWAASVAPSTPHTDCLLVSAWLHSTAAVLVGHPMVLVSLQCWGLCCYWAARSPTASPGLFKNSSCATQCQTSDARQDSSMLLGPVSPGRPLHKCGSQDEVPGDATSGTQPLWADFEETLPRRFFLNGPGLNPS